MRKRISVKNVDEEVMEMLAELREVEQRFTGAILGDAVQMYYGEVLGEMNDDAWAPEDA